MISITNHYKKGDGQQNRYKRDGNIDEVSVGQLCTEVGNICMICGKPAKDADDLSEWFTDGIYWVYCKNCDCWTEHPVPKELRQRINTEQTM